MDKDNKKIMICDDERGILDVLQMILEPEGFEVYTEIDSTRLIERVKKESPALLLLDLWMPAVSGYDIIKLVRKDRTINKIPIIVLSASRNEMDIAMETGADRFMAKPFDIEDLVLLVNEFMEGLHSRKK